MKPFHWLLRTVVYTAVLVEAGILIHAKVTRFPVPQRLDMLVLGIALGVFVTVLNRAISHVLSLFRK